MSILTDAEIASLKTLWARGDSAGMIAKALSRSRNAVIGKVHRLNLSKRISPLGMTLDERVSAGIALTHCGRGHPFDEQNTRWYSGRRFCHLCNNINQSLYRKKLRAERLAA